MVEAAEKEQISPKAAGKKRSLAEANGHVNTDQASQLVISNDQRQQLLTAFELIDCRGILDAALKGSESVSLRQALASASTFAELEGAVLSAYEQLSSQFEDLPAFPFSPVEPQYKTNTKKRTPEDFAHVQELGDTRQLMVDAEAERQEQLEVWLRRAKSLSAGSLRGIQGKGSVPPRPAVKPETTMAEPSSSKRILLHRSIAGVHEVFTSVNTGELSRSAQQALKHLTDTDVMVDAALPSSSSLGVPKLKLGSISAATSTLVSESDAPRDPRPVDFLSYGPFDSFAPTYDSSNASLSHQASVKLKRSREQGQAELKKPLLASLEDADLRHDPALIAQYNRLKSMPPLESPDQVETADAHQLHQELAELLDEAAGHGLSLDPEALRALHPGAVRPGFYGMLSPQATKGLREGTLVALPPGKY